MSLTLIIIDTPPVGIVTDALLLSHLANVTLFVVRQRYTTRGSVSLLDEIYRKGEMSNIAIVVNDISASGYYGYGLRYGYTLGYGHRYYDPGNYYTKGSLKGQVTTQTIKVKSAVLMNAKLSLPCTQSHN